MKFDLAFDVGPAVLTADLLDRVGDAVGDVLEESVVFDVFVGAGMEEGRRSIAVRLTLRAPDQTMRDEDVGVAVAGGGRRGGAGPRCEVAGLGVS